MTHPMNWKRAMALAVLTAGCRPQTAFPTVLPAPVVPVAPAPAETSSVSERSVDEHPAKLLMLRDFPAARSVFNDLRMLSNFPMLGQNNQAHEAAPFIADFREIARHDMAMADAWEAAFYIHSGWEPLFGIESDAVAREVWEIAEGVVPRNSPPPDPASLRLVSSPFGMGGSRDTRFNAIGALHDGRLESIYATALEGFSGFVPTPDNDGVLLVHDVYPDYPYGRGPRTFSKVSLTLLSLQKFDTEYLSLACEQVLDSVTISLLPTGGDEPVLHLRLRHSSSNRFAVLECGFDEDTCALLPNQPFHSDVPSLEITASTSYRVEPLATGLVLPRDVLRRTVHASPDGQWLSYVTQQVVPMSPEPDWSRTLWVARADGSDPRQIARGWGWLHARWEADGTLSFDIDPKPSDSMARRIEARRGQGSSMTPHQRQRLELFFAGFEALEDESIWSAVEYSVGHYDPSRQESWTERTTHPTRLWASFSVPRVTGLPSDRGEVPFESEDEPVISDPRCTVRRR